MRQPRPEIGAVLSRARLDEVEEDVARLEYARVVREQAENDSHQEALQVVAPVARRVESVMQPADQFGGLDVGRVLVAEGPALHAQDKAERLHVGGQVHERESGLLPFVEIVKLEGLEVACQNVARPVLLGQGVEVFPGLTIGEGEIASGTLMLDDQDAGPEQINVTVRVVEPLYVLLVARDGSAPDPEYLEEVVIEALRLALLVGRVSPLLGEGGGAGANLVPRQAHQIVASLNTRSLKSNFSAPRNPSPPLRRRLIFACAFGLETSSESSSR